MPDVWFVGRGSRTITAYQWSTYGVVADTVTWNSYNAWSIPHGAFVQAQLDILDNDAEFLIGQTGPRSYPRPILVGEFSQSGYAYYKAILDAYLELVEQGIIVNEMSQLQDVSDIGLAIGTAEDAAAVREIINIENLVVPVRFSTPVAVIGVSASDRAYNDRTIIAARMRVSSAPVGSSLVVDVQHFNGAAWSTIGTLTITSGSVTEASVTLNQVQVVSNLIRINCTSAGSTTAATGVAVDVVVTNA